MEHGGETINPLFVSIDALIRRLLYLILLLVSFTLPLALEAPVPGTNSNILFLVEPLAIGAMGLLILLAFVNIKVLTKLKWNLLDKIIMAHFVAIILSTIYSDDLFVSIKYSITLMLYLVLGYLTPRILEFTKQRILYLVYAHLLGAVILALYCIYNWSHMGIFYESSYEVAKPFLEIGHTNLSILMEVPLILAAGVYLLKKTSLVEKILLAIAISLYLAVIIFSCSKASYLIVGVGFFLFILNISRVNYSKLWKYGTIAVLCLGALAYLVYSGQMVAILSKIHFTEYKLLYIGVVLLAFIVFIFIKRKSLFGRLTIYVGTPVILLMSIWYLNDYLHKKKYENVAGSYYQSGSSNYNSQDKGTYKTTSMLDEIMGFSENDNNTSNAERKLRWLVGFQMLKDSPVLGVGMGTFPDKYLLIKNKNAKNATFLTSVRMNIHNLFLAWFSEGGFITFVTGFSFFIIVFWHYFNYLKDKRISILKSLLFVYFITFLLHGFAHDFSQEARVIIPFWIALLLLGRQFMAKNFKHVKSLATTS